MLTSPKKFFFLSAIFTIAVALVVANSPGGYVIFGWIALAIVSVPLFIRGILLSRSNKNRVFLALNIISLLLVLLVMVAAVWLIIAFQ